MRVLLRVRWLAALLLCFLAGVFKELRETGFEGPTRRGRSLTSDLLTIPDTPLPVSLDATNQTTDDPSIPSAPPQTIRVDLPEAIIPPTLSPGQNTTIIRIEGTDATLSVNRDKKEITLPDQLSTELEKNRSITIEDILYSIEKEGDDGGYLLPSPRPPSLPASSSSSSSRSTKIPADDSGVPQPTGEVTEKTFVRDLTTPSTKSAFEVLPTTTPLSQSEPMMPPATCQVNPACSVLTVLETVSKCPSSLPVPDQMCCAALRSLSPQDRTCLW